MTKLLITVESEKQPDDDMFFVREIRRTPAHRIRVKLTLIGPNGMRSVRYTWNMEARFEGNEERFRDQLRRSTWWEGDVWSEGNADRDNITSVEVHDPHEILKWLCPGQDFKDLFTEKMRLNDKPVRLPAPGTGKG